MAACCICLWYWHIGVVYRCLRHRHASHPDKHKECHRSHADILSKVYIAHRQRECRAHADTIDRFPFSQRMENPYSCDRYKR